MTESETQSYERIYYSLWETAQRYSRFTQFRVIGNSHDERMIPMAEIGTGASAVFCLAGVDGTDQESPELLLHMAQEYCRAYECGWKLRDFYDVRQLLDQVRICLVPVLNPDGYEICQRGFSAIRNPVCRQMLRMQNIPAGEFSCNARGMDIGRNFPTAYYTRQRTGQEPASENETRALIRIFQEYTSLGLLSFRQSGKKIVYYNARGSIGVHQKSLRIARSLQRCSDYRLERKRTQETGAAGRKRERTGTPEQFYSEVVKQPAFLIQTPEKEPGASGKAGREKENPGALFLPLEYIHSGINQKPQ